MNKIKPSGYGEKKFVVSAIFDEAAFRKYGKHDIS